VQDPAGGEFSGITIRSGMEIYEGEEARTLEDLHVGDLVDVEGMYDEFALAADMTGDKVSQINHPSRDEKATITKTGKTAAVPEPVDVDALLFATDRHEAEKWEGVLIRFRNVGIVSMPKSATSSDATLFEMLVSGPVIIQNGLFGFEDPVHMALTPETCFAELVGIGDYFFDYKLQPRSADDVVLTGGACPPRSELGFCEDMMDNDMDGKTDKLDPDCATGVSIEDIQKGVIAAGTPVEVDEAVVVGYKVVKPPATGPTAARKIYHVAKREAASSKYNAIVVSLKTGADFEIGSVVQIKGKVEENNDQTQIYVEVDGDMKCKNGMAPASCEIVTPPTAAAIPLADLTMNEAAEPWEAVFVTVTNVKFKEFISDKVPPDPNVGYWVFEGNVADATVTFNVENFLLPGVRVFATDPAAGTCFGQISGVVRYFKSKTRWGIYPWKLDQVVTSVDACNF